MKISNISYALKVLAILANHALVAHLFIKHGSHLTWYEWAFYLFLGHYVADFLVVHVHYVLDNYFEYDTPIIGNVVYFFREHHKYPLEFFKRDFFEGNYSGSLLFAIPTFFIQYLDLHDGVMIILAYSTLVSNYVQLIHKWTHTRKVPLIGVILQQCNLIVSREHHKLHHRYSDRNYALYSGCTDFILDAINYWAYFEIFVFLVTGYGPLNSLVKLDGLKNVKFSERLEIVSKVLKNQ